MGVDWTGVKARGNTALDIGTATISWHRASRAERHDALLGGICLGKGCTTQGQRRNDRATTPSRLKCLYDPIAAAGKDLGPISISNSDAANSPTWSKSWENPPSREISPRKLVLCTDILRDSNNKVEKVWSDCFKIVDGNYPAASQ